MQWWPLSRADFPHLEYRYLAGYNHSMTVSAATAVFSAAASCMLAFMAIVFALVFVIVPFGQHLFSGAGFMAQPGSHRLACLGYRHDDVPICPGGPGLDGPERFWAGAIFLTWTVIILLIASVMVLACWSNA